MGLIRDLTFRSFATIGKRSAQAVKNGLHKPASQSIPPKPIPPKPVPPRGSAPSPWAASAPRPLKKSSPSAQPAAPRRDSPRKMTTARAALPTAAERPRAQGAERPKTSRSPQTSKPTAPRPAPLVRPATASPAPSRSQSPSPSVSRSPSRSPSRSAPRPAAAAVPRSLTLKRLRRELAQSITPPVSPSLSLSPSPSHSLSSSLSLSPSPSTLRAESAGLAFSPRLLARFAGSSNTPTLQRVLRALREKRFASAYAFPAPRSLAEHLNQPADSAGRTALHCAAVRGPVQHVELLLRHGADVNRLSSPPAHGDDPEHHIASSALCEAILARRDNVVTALIAHGADVTRERTPRGKSLYELAELQGLRSDTLAWLRRAERAQREREKRALAAQREGESAPSSSSSSSLSAQRASESESDAAAALQRTRSRPRAIFHSLSHILTGSQSRLIALSSSPSPSPSPSRGTSSAESPRREKDTLFATERNRETAIDRETVREPEMTNGLKAALRVSQSTAFHSVAQQRATEQTLFSASAILQHEMRNTLAVIARSPCVNKFVKREKRAARGREREALATAAVVPKNPFVEHAPVSLSCVVLSQRLVNNNTCLLLSVAPWTCLESLVDSATEQFSVRPAESGVYDYEPHFVSFLSARYAWAGSDNAVGEEEERESFAVELSVDVGRASPHAKRAWALKVGSMLEVDGEVVSVSGGMKTVQALRGQGVPPINEVLRDVTVNVKTFQSLSQDTFQ